jgi:hypothetical protein
VQWEYVLPATWRQYLRRYTEVILPSRPLLEPRTTVISSCAKLAHQAAGVRVVTYVFADGNAAHTMLLAELLTQWRLKMLEPAVQEFFVFIRS